MEGFSGWLHMIEALGALLRRLLPQQGRAARHRTGDADLDVEQISARISDLERQRLEHDSVRWDLASSLIQRGNSFRAVNRCVDAERDYSRAFGLYGEDGVADDPCPDAMAVARRLVSRGMLERDAEKLTISITTFDQAMGRLNEAPIEGANYESILLRATILDNRGLARIRLQDSNGAIADFTGSIEFAHKSFENRRAAESAWALIEALSNRGASYSHSGRHAEALGDYNAALEWCRILSELDATVGRSSLARCLENRGWVFHNMAKQAEAQRDFAEAKAIKEASAR